jgi:Zn-dependent protease
MAEMSHIPRKPSQELLITIAGPAVNFAIAAVLVPFVWRIWTGVEPVYEHSLSGMTLQLFYANLFMGLFNLAPVFPMDGGRILRAALATQLPYLRATWWAVMVGRVLAVALIIWALYTSHLMMAVLFAFILMAGNTEYQIALRREQEEAYWLEMARRVASVAPERPDDPPLIVHGRN